MFVVSMFPKKEKNMPKKLCIFIQHRWGLILVLIILSILNLGSFKCSVSDDDDDDEISTPTTPAGPSQARVGENVTFTTGGASRDDGTIEYRIDFGDGTISGWSAEGKASHTYTKENKYKVSAQAQKGSITSSWSDSKTIEISAKNLEYLSSVWITLPYFAIAVGSSGKILHYDGQSWQEMESPTFENLSAVSGCSSQDIWVVGEKGTILFYDGKSWQIVLSPTKENLHIVRTNDFQVCVAGEKSAFLYKKNGNWEEISHNLSKIKDIYLDSKVRNITLIGEGNQREVIQK